MALFDRLIADDPRTTVIDLGYGLFEQFFDGDDGDRLRARKRGGARSSRSCCSSPTRRRRPCAPTPKCAGACETTAFVPVHNEAVSVMYRERRIFRRRRNECGLIRIPRLSPIVRGVVDRPSFSFGAYMAERPGGPTEIHSWIGTIFTEFRELELRLLMGKLGASLSDSIVGKLSTALRSGR